MDNLCRTCAKYSENVQASVFLESRFELKFADMIKECTSVNVSAMDQLPKIICVDCQLKLELSYAFKRQSLQSQQKLIEILKADVTSNQHHENMEVIEMKPFDDIKPEEIDSFEDVDLAETLKKSFISKTNSNECNRCCKPCINQQTLIEHKKTHTGDLTPVKCYLCGKGFQHKQSLNRHMKTHPSEDRIEIINPSKFDPDKDTNLDRSSTNPSEDSDLDNSNAFEHDESNLPDNLPEFECKRCGKPFYNEELSTEHLDSHSNDLTPYKCYICGNGLQLRSSLKRHIQTQHECKKSDLKPVRKARSIEFKKEFEGSDQDSDKIPLPDYLNRVDPLENNDSTPTKDDTNKGQYTCVVCGKCYTSKVSLSSHKRKHRPPPKPRKIEFKCFKCQEIYANLKLLDEHLTLVHNQERFWCEQCNGFYESNKLLEEHVLKVHQLTCKRCLLKCESVNKFTEHLETHRNDPMPFKCRFCGKGIRFPYYIIEHTMIHTGERPNVCQICGQSFVSHSNLIPHMRTHTDERPYSCKICPARFRQYNSLRAHERTHDSIRPYSCEKCGTTFKHKSGLHFHMKKHLGLIKKSPCTICGKVLARHQMLRHMECHSGERKHNCELCQKAFLRSYGLKVHMKTHTGEKPFSCEVCSKQFSQKHVLLTHMNTHQS